MQRLPDSQSEFDQSNEFLESKLCFIKNINKIKSLIIVAFKKVPFKL